ncbi:hypothetical protein HBI56_129480 [Parastagonospora nodorum]|nr:hypothetical protein HBH51_105700 [Parastagonospora nodorum]KAH3996664.1 hypothetical protein HBI10_151400 [Parastagonospora nodorum]KAH4012420.1 hypothetical protein HBI13_186090 [Parastagonospora nodorum]KAH4029428.1 hypothetical protein HBI09_133200 [Parastagonospora nodorum]KAH4086531.1 hypothetical protein HBH46_204670 [Parastagonospora nodorum]
MQPAKYKLQQAEECAPLPQTDRQAFGAPTCALTSLASMLAIRTTCTGKRTSRRTLSVTSLLGGERVCERLEHRTWRGDSRIEQQQATRKQLPSSVTRRSASSTFQGPAPLPRLAGDVGTVVPAAAFNVIAPGLTHLDSACRHLNFQRSRTKPQQVKDLPSIVP